MLYQEKNGWLNLFSDHKEEAVVYGLEGPLGLTKFSIDSDQLMALTFKHFISNANNFSDKIESEYDFMPKIFLLLKE